jgi:hypothetical protein
MFRVKLAFLVGPLLALQSISATAKQYDLNSDQHNDLPKPVTSAFFNNSHGMIDFPTFIIAVQTDGSRKLVSLIDDSSFAPSPATVLPNLDKDKNLYDWFRAWEGKLADAFVPEAFGQFHATISVFRQGARVLSVYGFRPGFLNKKPLGLVSNEVLTHSITAALEKVSHDAAAKLPDVKGLDHIEVKLGFAGNPSGGSFGIDGD